MTVDDVDQVLAIENASFPRPWRREHFVHEIRENRFAYCPVVRRGERVLAYACARHVHETLEINDIAVHPEERRRGLGGWLLRLLLDEGARRGCTRAELEVRPSNSAALSLYRAHAFAEVGRRRGYYAGEGEDAIVMEAALAPDRPPEAP
jgi:ribosomal-protein-alanine N-acetyltransferase